MSTAACQGSRSCHTIKRVIVKEIFNVYLMFLATLVSGIDKRATRACLFMSYIIMLLCNVTHIRNDNSEMLKILTIMINRAITRIT